MRFRLIERFLLEGKNLQKTFDQYRSKLIDADTGEEFDSDEEAYDYYLSIISIDPTYIQGGTTTGDYGIWLLNQELKGNLDKFRIQHHFEIPISDILTEFIEKKSNLEKKDINQYKTPEDLYNVLQQTELSARQKERKIRKDIKGAKQVGSTANFDIYIPETYEASCALGKGSGWCTADSRTRQYFDYYKDKYGGNYYIIISKDGKWKYQVHFESGQYSAAGTNPDINNPNEEEMIELEDIISRWPELKDTLTEIQANADPATIIRNILADKLELDNEIILKLSLDEIEQYIQVHNGIKQWFIQDVNEIPSMRAFLALQNNKDAFVDWEETFTRYDKDNLLDSDEMWKCTEKAFRFKLLKRIQQLKIWASTEYLKDPYLAFSIFGDTGFIFKLQLMDLAKSIINSNEGYYFEELIREKNFDELEEVLQEAFKEDDKEQFNKNVLHFSSGILSNSLDQLPSMCKAYFSCELTLQFFFESLEDEIIDAVDEKRFSQKYAEDQI